MGIEAYRFYNQLGRQFAEKRDEPTSSTINLTRTELSFSLVMSALLCIRGSRSHKVKKKESRDLDVALAVAETMHIISLAFPWNTNFSVNKVTSQSSGTIIDFGIGISLESPP